MTLCHSDTSQIWIPILLVYKAVELVFSLIFAFETRKVKVKELNDSKIIVFCVYTIVVSTIALTPTALLLQKKPTVCYAVKGIVFLLTATVLLTIVYVPKVTFSSEAEHAGAYMHMHIYIMRHTTTICTVYIPWLIHIRMHYMPLVHIDGHPDFTELPIFTADVLLVQGSQWSG